jgi:hypothetical protein
MDELLVSRILAAVDEKLQVFSARFTGGDATSTLGGSAGLSVLTSAGGSFTSVSEISVFRIAFYGATRQQHVIF